MMMFMPPSGSEKSAPYGGGRGAAYFFGAQGFAAAHGLATFFADAFTAFFAFGAQGFMALGAHGFADAADAASGLTATRLPTAAIAPSVCRDFFSTDMFFPLV